MKFDRVEECLEIPRQMWEEILCDGWSFDANIEKTLINQVVRLCVFAEPDGFGRSEVALIYYKRVS